VSETVSSMTGGLSESLQDYLEAVYLAAERHGVARMKEVAERVGVGRSSATAGVQALAERGLVHYEPYQYVTLTEEGRRLGRALLRRHRVLKRFLAEVLGLPEDEAEAVGCKMEHIIKGEVLDRFAQFLRFAEEQTCGQCRLAEAFSHFRERAERADDDEPPDDEGTQEGRRG